MSEARQHRSGLAEPPVDEPHLAKNRLGIAGIVFFVVAAAAPLVGMTGAVPVAIVLGNGAAAPGAYLAVGLTLLVFSVGYSAMSHKVTNTGAFFAYVGPRPGHRPGRRARPSSLCSPTCPSSWRSSASSERSWPAR